MRISDWSSDVCSSDLAGAAGRGAGGQQIIDGGLRDEGPAQGAVECAHGLGVAQRLDAVAAPRTGERHPGADALRQVPAALLARNPQPGDRKSVVEGKSVSVRVDLGGRRII